MKPAVLLGHIQGAEDVARALLERADLDIVVFFDVALDVLREEGLPCLRFANYLTEAQGLRAHEEVTWRTGATEAVLESQEFRREWPYTSDAAWERIVKLTSTRVRNDFFQECVIIDTLRRCALETDLRLVMVQEDICRDSKTLVKAAQRLGIPCLHTIHGFPTGSFAGSFLGEIPGSDVVAVYSDRAAAIYEDMGLPRERIVVTGNPLWDAYHGPPRPALRNRVAEALTLDLARPVITYALTYGHGLSLAGMTNPALADEATDSVLDAFASLRAAHPDWQFVLRPHPNDPAKPDDLEKRAARAGLVNVCVDTITSSASALAVTDVLVCVESNIAIEGILQGIPVVNCVIDEQVGDFFTEGIGPLFDADDAVCLVRRRDELATTIEQAATDPLVQAALLQKRERSIRKFNLANDGGALERLIGAALEMVRAPELFVAPVAPFPEAAQGIRILGPAEEPSENTIVFEKPLVSWDEGKTTLQAARDRLQEKGRVVAYFPGRQSAQAEAARAEGIWAPQRPGGAPASDFHGFTWEGVQHLVESAGFQTDRVLSRTRDEQGRIRWSPGVCKTALGWAVRVQLSRGNPQSVF